MEEMSDEVMTDEREWVLEGASRCSSLELSRVCHVDVDTPNHDSYKFGFSIKIIYIFFKCKRHVCPTSDLRPPTGLEYSDANLGVYSVIPGYLCLQKVKGKIEN